MTRKLELAFSLSTYEYPLDRDLIAQYPAEHRDGSRLEVLFRKGPDGPPRIEHRSFTDIVQYFRPGDLLVLNDSHVIPARVMTKKAATGGRIEVLLLGAMGAPAHRWEALIRGSVSPGQVLRAGNELEIHAVERRSGGRWVVDLHCAGPPLEILERLGSPPLPPYIRREWTEADRERYQTVYARPPGRRERISGSVAAPTAGLHFSPELIEKIQAQGARIAFVTLHIGPGTFRPVRCGDIRRHRMDPEPFEIPEATVQSLREARHAGGRIMAVGTSVARTLEAAAGDGDEVRTSGTTDLFIFPGYRFRVVQGLITNFHMPGSTLYMLVCAFAGVETMHAAYAEAQRLRYRFLSFGDAMVIL